MSHLLANTTKYAQVLPYGNQGSVKPDEVLDFYLPQMGFLQLNSLSLWFDVAMSTGGSCAFPRDGESIIQTLEVFVNGQMVNCIQNYQQIYRILSDYGYFPPENGLTRYGMRNGLLNGNPSYAAVASVNGTYQARNWLGVLGEQAIVDLSKNSIHIRITISPRTIIASAATTDTFTLSNVYLTCKFFEKYTGDLSNQISFSDFKSVVQYNPTTTQETFLKIFTKNVDYVVGTILRTTNKTIATSVNANILTTSFFARNGTVANYNNWNFKVNQRPVYNYQPKVIEGIESMMSIFPRGLRDFSLTVNSTPSTMIVDSWASGAKVGFINDEPEEVELSFTTTQGSSSIANYSLLFAKIDNTVPLNV